MFFLRGVKNLRLYFKYFSLVGFDFNIVTIYINT